jgi:hypothetical protein
MAGDPDICVREHIGNVIIEVLKTYQDREEGQERQTYDSDGIKQALFYKCFL